MAKSKRSRVASQASEENGNQGQAQGVDSSPYVFQGDKLSFDLNIRPFPWTEKQSALIQAGLAKRTNYILCEAPPGVGKTLMAVYIGLKLLQERRISNVYFVRLPQESASKGIGFMPGDQSQKMEAFQMPMMDQLNQLLPAEQIAKLLKQGFIQTVPLGYVKGRTFNASLVIVDEAEDLTEQEMQLIMARLGRFSRMVLIGDHEQANVRNSGFLKVYDGFNSPECVDQGIICLRFDESDSKRNGVLAYVIRRFRQIKRGGDLTFVPAAKEREPMFPPSPAAKGGL